MKIYSLCILFISVILFATCNHENKCETIAIIFMNSYAKHCTSIPERIPISDSEWVQKNDLVTDNFKKTYFNILEKAKKDDPEIGLGFDPILAAQDLPDSGFILLKRDTNCDYIILQGKDWPEFNVVVKTIKLKSKWYVDGAGIINIPPSNQIKH
jgi:hypothetical protein